MKTSQYLKEKKKNEILLLVGNIRRLDSALTTEIPISVCYREHEKGDSHHQN